MKQLSIELFNKYKENPLQYDEEVRNFCKIREDRYYTVSIWSQEGQVRENNNVRVVKSKKISKSDQNG